MKYRLMAVDIDGTLLDNKGMLTKETAEAIAMKKLGDYFGIKQIL